MGSMPSLHCNTNIYIHKHTIYILYMTWSVCFVTYNLITCSKILTLLKEFLQRQTSSEIKILFCWTTISLNEYTRLHLQKQSFYCCITHLHSIALFSLFQQSLSGLIDINSQFTAFDVKTIRRCFQSNTHYRIGYRFYVYISVSKYWNIDTEYLQWFQYK